MKRLLVRRLRQLKCRVCGVAQGELHDEGGCSQEWCPGCGGQLGACKCADNQLPRVPFIMWPNICGLCGEISPEMFDVPDCVWTHYVQTRERRKMVCISCWDWLTETVDGKKFAAQHGDAVPLWSTEFHRRHGISDEAASPF